MLLSCARVKNALAHGGNVLSTFKHHVKPSDLKPGDLDKIIDKFYDENIGWLNKQVFKDFDLTPRQAGLLGDANKFSQCTS